MFDDCKQTLVHRSNYSCLLLSIFIRNQNDELLDLNLFYLLAE
jgi:hypothetical protein